MVYSGDANVAADIGLYSAARNAVAGAVVPGERAPGRIIPRISFRALIRRLRGYDRRR